MSGDQFMYCVLAACGAGLVFCIWFLVQNNITLEERRRLIDEWDREPDWRAAARRFQSVSYDQHLWARVRLSDPMRLYGRGK